MFRFLHAFKGVKYYLFVSFILWTSILVPKFALAQTDSLKANNLKEIKITQKRSSLQNLSPTPLQILNGTALKKLNSLSVADAIRYFSGVQLKDYGGIGGLKTINVRSMGTNHTAVFYDGVQLGNAQNGQVDLGKFSLDNIEEISLYSGQKSELLMPAKAFASASSLYLKSIVPTFEANQNRNFRIALKTGSFGLIDPSVTYNQRLNHKLSVSLNAELINANGKYKYRYTNSVYDTTVVRHNADIFAKRIEGGLYGTTADSSIWQLKLYNYNSERGVPGAIVANRFEFPQRQWDDNFFVQSSYQNNFNKKLQFLVNAKYAYDFTRYLDPERVSLSGALDNRYAHQELYLSFASQYHLTKYWDLSLSTDYTFQKLDANLENFAYPERQTGLIAFATKLSWQRFSIQGNILTTLVADRVKNNSPAGDKAEYTPTLMASWQPFAKDNLRLRAFYKSIFRMPTFNDLYYTFIGNSKLNPEYTTQYDFGFTYSKSFERKRLTNISIQADAYYSAVRDKIIAIPTLTLFRWTMVNLGKVEVKGLETNIQSNWVIDQVQVIAKANYTYERALDVTPRSEVFGQQIPYIPINSGSITFGVDYKNFGFNYSYIYTGERYSQKANIPVNYVEPWYTHDLALRYSFTVAKINYSIATEMNNVFNQYYDVVLNYPMPGRNFRITLITKFN
ncbi:TonB-dependent siderophore receptor [Pedobacter sp. Leaf250]|uniref:TonB-dependent receptor plug domain-containing protein n=1 Tax=Pedobacter sp. Leaf250 TaxID=2876559 RepID=UPI001E50784B|nr:TonB-dependent receptor [Pedobacter sp. Leaf250]